MSEVSGNTPKNKGATVDKRKTFKARVWRKFTEEMGKFFGGMVAFMFGVVYIIVVFFARYFVLGRNSSTTYFLDILLDSVFVGFLFLVSLAIVNLLRAPYLAGKELETALVFHEAKKLRVEVKTYGGVQSRKDKNELCALINVKNSENKKMVGLEVVFAYLGVYTIGPGDLSDLPRFYDLGNFSWFNYEEQFTGQISLVPEEEAQVYFAMTNTKTNSVLFATNAIGKLPNKESVYNVKMRLKGKLEGDSEYRFYTHDILLYWHPKTKKSRRQFGILDGKSHYQDIDPAFLRLLKDMS